MKNLQFVVEISGRDLSGLLVTFTDCIKELGYNIDDINLSTGGGRHTTFLTCVPEKSEVRHPLPGRARQDLEDMLVTKVRSKYEEQYKSEDRIMPADVFTVKVWPSDDESDPPQSSRKKRQIRVYAGIAVSHVSGIVYKLAKCFEAKFNITSATISPVLLRQKVAEGVECNAEQLDQFRILWLTLDSTTSQTPGAADVIDSRTDDAGEVAKRIRGMIEKGLNTEKHVSAEVTTLYVDYGNDGSEQKRLAVEVEEFTPNKLRRLLGLQGQHDEVAVTVVTDTTPPAG